MKRRQRTFCAATTGVTLVEALVGTAVLGGVLVAILLADAGFRRQTRKAEDRVVACHIANELLASWWPTAVNPDSFPRNGEGSVETRPGWSWRTQSAECEALEEAGGEVVALEIVSPEHPTADPLVRVEVVLPKERVDETAGGNDAD
jgi:type II secretory pathway pseudopilin PulG